MSEQKQTDLYDELMVHLYEAMDDTLHSVADAMQLAKNKVAQIGHHSQEEINRIADFVLRDVLHAGQSTPKDDHLADWLKFDIELVENFALDAFWSLADKARVQLAALELQANQPKAYEAGEVASPGTFVCDQCGKTIAFKSTSVIPVCPACLHTHFSRQ